MFTVSLAMALPFSLVGVPWLISLFLTPIFFIFFKRMESKQKLIVPKSIKIFMQCAIAIAALWISAKLFAFTIRGGGPSFVVNQYAIFTIVPAIGVLVILDIIVLFKSYGKKVGLIALAVVILAASIRASMPYLNDYTHETQWHEYCKSAVDVFNVEDENIEKLELYNFVASIKYKRSKDGQMKENRSNSNRWEDLGLELLKRGVIDEYEVIAKGEPKHYSSKLENNEQIETPINEAKATHRVTYKLKQYSEGYGSKRFIRQQTISIANKKTGKIIAQRTQFVDPVKGNRSCAQVYNNQISTVDFLEKTILKSRE